MLRCWGWFIQTVPQRHTWKWLYSKLYTCVSAKFCVVGTLRTGGSLARAFCLLTKEWIDLPPPMQERNMAAVVRDSSGDLVVIGGLPVYNYSDFKAVRTAEIFKGGVWLPFPDMNKARCCCSGALDKQGRIHVVGGGETMYSTSEVTNVVETYVSSSATEPSGSWYEAAEMKEARCALGVAYSYATNYLFAAGGYGGHSHYLDSAERLDLSGGSSIFWESLPQMSCKRAGCNATVGPDHRIFVLGGGPDGRSEHNTMEALDPRECRWQTSFPQLHYGRHYNSAAFGPDGLLYVAGAFRHDGQLDVVERYDPRSNAWEDLPNIGRHVEFSAGTFLF